MDNVNWDMERFQFNKYQRLPNISKSNRETKVCACDYPTKHSIKTMISLWVYGYSSINVEYSPVYDIYIYIHCSNTIESYNYLFIEIKPAKIQCDN